MDYRRRIVDIELDELITGLPAIALEGAKGVGKTATATRRADRIYSLEDANQRAMLEVDPVLAFRGEGTIFIDEWQHAPYVWNAVRRAVDDGAAAGRFLLAGSAGADPSIKLHSGAGRIVRLMMRPMSLPERGIETPTVSLQALLDGGAAIAGQTSIGVEAYAEQILASGFPGIWSKAESVRRHLLDSYIDRIIDHDITEMGQIVRRPASLLQWLTAYGAATARTASYASLLEASTAGESAMPTKVTAIVYRELLQRIWILDPLPAWVPVFASLKALGQAPKLHLVDPALAARLMGATMESLLRGAGPDFGQGVFLGALFESLAVQTVRVLAQACDARVFHMRTHGGEHEIDIIVERRDHQVIAIEVKLSGVVRPADVAQLNWLDQQLPGRVVDKVLINTGPYAYRRPDGVAVVPLALLGP